MKFEKVNPKQNFPELEKDVLNFWKKNKIFEKSLKLREKAKLFNFYDGPPFATGLPHYGHILAMAIKDTIVRFKTMQGFFVPRKFGWDCHGLPVENLIEKELGINGKPDIEKMGIEKFNNACKSSVLRYTGEWRKTIQRMGRWGDLDNVYVTMDNDYIESIWWVFKQIWDKKLIYKGKKSMPYCPRCGTPLSNFETNLGYKDNVVDPSVYIKFKVKNQKNTYFLAWTTTPWTLPGNAALAIGSKIDYAKIKVGDEYLILAKDRLCVIDEKYTISEQLNNKDLIGLQYEPLYNFVKLSQKAHYVISADFVSIEDGTGIVHIAPAFGEDDLSVGQKYKLPMINYIDKNGCFTAETGQWQGLFVKKADVKVIDDLIVRRIMYKHGTIKHTYPFCWRCDSPLIYFAISTWFIKVSEIKDKLVKNNQKIHWIPKHIKNGRFGKWLEDARDWAVTRNRYWGAPVPIWQCEKCSEYICIGSKEELQKYTNQTISKLDFHRPYIDQIKLNCKCGGKMLRIEEVLDCWFESGSMPYAQFHYPFDKSVNFDKRFPADFIAEGLDQTRGWFYTLHVIATILYNQPAFFNCIVNGIVLANDGKKLSKKLRNYPEPDEIFNVQGSDALRWFLLSSPASAGDDVRFSKDHIAEIVRKITLIYWNTYLFFINYSLVDKWNYENNYQKSANILDKWILAYLNKTVKDVTRDLNNYELAKGIRLIEEFIAALSTWYLRRSRKRRDNEFYSTLFDVLLTLTKLMAPFMPFITENVYQNLRKNLPKDAVQSIHLTNWPIFNDKINEDLLDQMNKVRRIVEGVHSIRAQNSIKVRQPLQELVLIKANINNADLLAIIADEVNVKKIIEAKQAPKNYQKNTIDYIDIYLNTKITEQLELEGIAREIIRYIQIARKNNNLAPTDVIDINYESDDRKINKVISKFAGEIKKQTISKSFVKGISDRASVSIKKDKIKIFISKIND